MKNMLDYEISDVLEKLDVDFTTLRLRCKCLKTLKNHTILSALKKKAN